MRANRRRSLPARSLRQFRVDQKVVLEDVATRRTDERRTRKGDERHWPGGASGLQLDLIAPWLIGLCWHWLPRRRQRLNRRTLRLWKDRRGRAPIRETFAPD